ncbi:hypothetical protein EDD86DRAFT_196752 [Gorgonomyces haynaldii]|nr:hypothetical protein EDD86DRAFT_196752 [Gorgonomyces haynaldii]
MSREPKMTTDSYLNRQSLLINPWDAPQEPPAVSNEINTSQHSLNSSYASPVEEEDPWQTKEPQPEAQPIPHGNPTVEPKDMTPVGEFRLDLDNEVIDIDTNPEREGVVFKHVNYTIKTTKRRKTVTRRYSNFIWLYAVLVQSYPYRLIPPLPPKKAVGMNEIFLERRRRGLLRFLQFVTNHPTIKSNALLDLFLTYEGDLRNYLSQNQITIERELMEPLEQHQIDLIPQDIEDRIAVFRSSLHSSAQTWQRLSLIMEDHARNLAQSSAGFEAFSYGLVTLASESEKYFKKKSENCKLLDQGYVDMSQGVRKVSQVMLDHAMDTNDVVAESLKSQMELLEGFKQLFARRDTAFGQMSSYTVEKRIQVNQIKLREIKDRQDMEKEVEKLAHLIELDTNELEHQKMQTLVIRYCIWSEFLLYHQLKADIVSMFQEFVKSQIQHASQYVQMWNELSFSVYTLPNAF